MRVNYRHITQGTGVFIILAGMFVVAGWLFDIQFLKTVGPDFVSMKINSALCFVFSGALLILNYYRDNKNIRRSYFLCTAVILLIGLITLTQYLFHYNTGIDEFLYTDIDSVKEGLRYPGRMSAATSFCFTVMGIVFLLFNSNNRTSKVVSQLLLHFVTLISFLAMVGYIYSVPSFYTLSLVNSMAFHTSVLLFLLSIAASFINPHVGITGLFTGFRTGNIMARRLFPLMVLILLILGYLQLLAHWNAWVTVGLGNALFVISFMIVGLLLIWSTANRLTRLDIRREESEEKSLSLERQLHHTMDNMLEGAQIIGFDWKYKYVNDSFLKHAKYSREELIGHTVMEKYPGIEKTEIYNVYKKCFEERVPIHLENEFTFPDGSQGWFELSFQPVPEGVFILSVDITERKRAEQNLINANKMLDKRAAELQASNKELERFAYVASHDLQEPLRMVSSFLHLLEKKMKDTLDETSRQYIDFAVDGSERMKTLIQDLLQYSRVGTEKEAIKDVDCNEVMNSVKAILALSIAENHAELIIHPLPVIKAVQPQIIQLFQNLVANALKYRSEKSPVIEVGCANNNEHWEFYVKDNGIGIESKFFEKIFIIFQRLHSKKDYSGTGIGLSICKKIIEKHGGQIRVESEPGKGSTFLFTISKNLS